MTKYCKCGHKKSEHHTDHPYQKWNQRFCVCDGGIFHHSHWEYLNQRFKNLSGYIAIKTKMKDSVQLDNCLCPKFRLSKFQKHHAKRWKNTVVYDKTRGVVN